jgi:hypothetical protein
MLRVQSFKFSDSDEINKLLSIKRLASGAHILVSNGELIIPYEDGEPPTKEQRIIAIKEQKNTTLAQKDIIVHSQDVLEFLIRDAKERVAEAEGKVANLKGSSSEKDQAKERAKVARSALSQLESQKEQNAHELARIAINVEMFDEAVKAIEDGIE